MNKIASREKCRDKDIGQSRRNAVNENSIIVNELLTLFTIFPEGLNLQVL